MKAKSLYKTIADFDKNMKARYRLLSNRVNRNPKQPSRALFDIIGICELEFI